MHTCFWLPILGGPLRLEVVHFDVIPSSAFCMDWLPLLPKVQIVGAVFFSNKALTQQWKQMQLKLSQQEKKRTTQTYFKMSVKLKQTKPNHRPHAHLNEPQKTTSSSTTRIQVSYWPH